MKFAPVQMAKPRTKRAIAVTALAVLFLIALLFAKVVTDSESGPRPADAASPTPNLFVAPSGNDAGPCSQVAPCADWNVAYGKASPGDVIEVGGGTYGSQTVRDRPTLATTAPVLIRIADGANARVQGDLEIQSHDVTLEGGGTLGVDEPNRITATGEMNVTMATVGMGDRRVIVEDVHGSNDYLHADGVTIRDSEFGPNLVCQSSDGTNDDVVKLWYWNGANGDRGSRHVNFLNNDVHGNIETGCTGSPHDDGIQMELDDSLVAGNRVWDCGTQCLFQGYDSTGLVVENNMVEETATCARCGDSSEVGMAGTLTFRYNTIYGNVTFSGGTVPSNPSVYGNVFLSGQGCDGAATYDHNVFPASSGSACGTNAKRGSPSFATAGALGSRSADFHLSTSDSVAVDAGDPSRYPALDFDGEARPAGAAPDAGADEVNAIAPPPPTTTTVATTTVATTTAPTTTTTATTATTVPTTTAPTTTTTPVGDELGSSTLYATNDFSDKGFGEAFKATAARSQPVSTVRFYVDAKNVATRLYVAVYTDAAGKPGTRLTTANAVPVKGQWNTLAVPAVDLVAGRPYWLAVLGTGGQLWLRDHCCGSGTTAARATRLAVSSLPVTWVDSGWTRLDGPASLVAN